MSHLIRVVVAVIVDKDGRILITQRVAGKPQSGKWEFPGGKISLYETGLQALKREVMEEVNIQIEKAIPFMQIYHDYTEYAVLLDIWQVEKFSGVAKGMENQQIAWANFEQLKHYDFLAANKYIINALKLPNFYYKLGNFYTVDNYLEKIKNVVQAGYGLIELGATNLSPKDYANLLTEVFALNKKLNVKILLNASLEVFQKFDGADGLSILARDLRGLTHRPITEDKLFCVWCNDEQDIHLAELLKADFIVTTPLQLKDNATLGWNKLQKLTLSTNLPVFVDGEVEKSSFARVRALGGLGVVVKNQHDKISANS